MEQLKEPSLQKYLAICKRFHKYNIPQLRFKEVSEEYKKICKTVYGIYEEDICKASAVIFFISYIITFITLFFFVRITIFYSLGLSIIPSCLLAFSFNQVIFRRIKKDEKLINGLLYLIKINYTLMRKTSKDDADPCIAFIKLIINYNIPIADAFILILNKIHIGYTPEDELQEIITPSKDFNQFRRELLIKKFEYDYATDYYSESTSEKNFKVLIRSLESKIGILFFIGLFFPLLLCFFILFAEIDAIYIVVMIPFFLYLFHYLFKKLIKVDVVLIGLLNEYSGHRKALFDEFLLFLESLALNLENNLSPESAFIKAYSENRSHFFHLKKVFEEHLSNLISLQYTFKELIHNLKQELEAPRYKVILDVIYTMLERSVQYTSEQITEIINTIQRHRKLEERFKIIIQSNQFVIMIFVFLFPAILGTIGGMLPLIIGVSRGIADSERLKGMSNMYELVNIVDVVVIFVILLSCNIISCFYLLKIIQHKRAYLVIIISSGIFVFCFLQGILFMFTSL